MKKYIIYVLIGSLPLVQGCAIGLIAAGVGVVKAGNAKKKEAQVKEQSAYGTYRIEMEKVNIEREKSGLKPNPILTLEEWKGIPTEVKNKGK